MSFPTSAGHNATPGAIGTGATPFWGDGLVLRPEFPPTEGVRIFNATYHTLTYLHLHHCDAGYTPTRFQLASAPKELRYKLRVIFDVLDAFLARDLVQRSAWWRSLGSVKVSVLSESAADEAAIRALVDAIFGEPTERPRKSVLYPSPAGHFPPAGPNPQRVRRAGLRHRSAQK